MAMKGRRVRILILLETPLGRYRTLKTTRDTSKNKITAYRPVPSRLQGEISSSADRKSTRLNSSHSQQSRMPSSA